MVTGEDSAVPIDDEASPDDVAARYDRHQRGVDQCLDFAGHD